MSYSKQSFPLPQAVAAHHVDPGVGVEFVSGLSTNSPEDIGADIVTTVLSGYRGTVAVRLWNGRLVHGCCMASCTLVFKQPGALRDLILHRDIQRLAESYLQGAIDVDGKLEALFELKAYLGGADFPLLTRLRLLSQALRLPVLTKQGAPGHRSIGSRRQPNSRDSIAHHYDVGNDFYRLWLDSEMVYSCAYYKDTGQGLDAAQRDKLDYICRKLRLAPGQTLLDIGCGWGALALWAARYYGVTVHGITLSHEQQRLASERVREAGLEDQVHIELLDYRDLPDDVHYDRVVSVGMFEHIGVKNFPNYFGTVRRVLKRDGLFLNHGITSDTGWQRSPLTRFMNRYIFPDGELARISDVADAMERAGFEILDVESLRRHYALTLRHWGSALEANRDAAIAATSTVTYRLWRLYMAGCAYHFDEGSIGLHQLLVGHQHQSTSLPLRRDTLYIHAGERSG